jgi:hypothetical protein
VRLAAHGLSIDVPEGWEARIFHREGGGPVLHLATFALHERDGDYGAAATGRMGTGDAFASMLEFRRDAGVRPGHGLFAARGRPRPRAGEFAADQLQVRRPGQLGWQRFFTDGDRACCLYAVVAPGRRASHPLVEALAEVLTTVAHG